MTHADAPDSLIVIGGSAGAQQPVQEMLAALPNPLAAPIIIALHSVPMSKLTELLQRNSHHDIRRVEDGDTPEAGVIHIVPGGRHAFLRAGKIRLSDEVEDSGFRPSIDMLFMTAAAQYGPGAIGVILSGMLKDGMRGCQVIYDLGGRSIVQNPDDALYDSMPAAVIRADHPRAILSASELSEWLISKVGTIET
ncbi:chemotaxis protein CheB [Sulfitobacter albidus]|uniref:protein-glutamate methylesterase n=1 Tax=Sulfitobacter albidus TaxID=2829501 RepID=A0A975JDD2_9RHOB|nr:chemotaxis protein CheB [Sulfitobacter albidus]QUJ76404.1 chemotaxis protein CheB [Sulfitobacter albidus]